MLLLSPEELHPLNRWMNNYISAGPEGSVGDALVQVQLKTSVPGEYREAKLTKGKKEKRFGSNVQDGQFKTYSNKGEGARVLDSNWASRRRFKTARGWVYQDLRPADRRMTAVMAGLPQYSWRTQVATTNRAVTPGFLFPIPAGGLLEEPANLQMRGGLFPSVVATGGGGRVLAGPSAVGVGDTGSQKINYKYAEIGTTGKYAQSAVAGQTVDAGKVATDAGMGGNYYYNPVIKGTAVK